MSDHHENHSTSTELGPITQVLLGIVLAIPMTFLGEALSWWIAVPIWLIGLVLSKNWPIFGAAGFGMLIGIALKAHFGWPFLWDWLRRIF